MANETPITLTGRLTRDPELRFTPNSHAVVNIDIACNDRRYNKATNDWEDGITVFWRCSAWRELAERIATTLHKGDAVVLHGHIEGQKWQDKDTGADRHGHQVQIQAIGPDLRWMEVRDVRKASREQQQGQQRPPTQQQAGGWGNEPQQQPPAQHQPQQAPQQQTLQPSTGGPRQDTGPWQQPARAGAAAPGGYDEPPF